MPLNLDFQRCFEAPNLMENFNIAVSDVSPEDIYYLLQAFFEMATERQRTKDWDLIQAISAHIFNVMDKYYNFTICLLIPLYRLVL